MYIPKEIIWFILGFISFPVMCYVIYVIKYKNKEIESDEKLEEEKQNK